MKATRHRCLMVIACASVLCGSLTTDAFAEATTIVTNGHQCPVTTLDPGEQWLSEEGVLHTRDRVTLFRQTGDLTGDLIATFSTAIDQATCQGQGHSKAIFTGEYTPGGTPTGLFGTFETTTVIDIQLIPGPFGGCFGPGTTTTTGVGQGSGGFERMKRFVELSFPVFDGSCGPFPPGTSWTGYILDPSGSLQP